MDMPESIHVETRRGSLFSPGRVPRDAKPLLQRFSESERRVER